MANSVLSADHFHDEPAALAFIEARIWPNGPTCPRCGERERIGRLNGKTTKLGMCKCYVCRKPFTATVGTVMESSHIPLHIWLQAMHLLCTSKKGMSSNQLHRTLGITLKSAWFLSHRIREAMKNLSIEPMGGEGAIVEVDETFYGTKEKKAPKARGYAHKHAVLSLVERRPEGARVMSFHVGGTAAADLLPIIKANVNSGSHIMTDEAGQYGQIAKHFAKHDFVTHGTGEYGRGDIHTNTVEGYYSVFKRGMIGIYQHCGEAHLHRYTAEFDFRYNNRVRLGINDVARIDLVVKGIVGKRLTYRTTRGEAAH